VKSLFLALACVLGIAAVGAVPPQAQAYPSQVGSIAEAPVVEVADVTRAEQSVVRIDTTLDVQHAIGTGTGVVLSPDGVVLTNNHVIRGATGVTATDVGNGQTYPVDVLGYDRNSDIAVLQLRGATDLPAARLAGPATVAVGEPVTGIGFPDGGDLARSSGVVRALDKGIVANDDLTGSAEELGGLIDYDADTRPGASGGPLVDDGAQVVGIVTAASQNYRMDSTGGFAIPIERAAGIADAIRSGNASGSIHVGPTGILGVAIRSENDQSGVPVRGILRGGPVEKAGLTPGDVITAIDGLPTRDATALTDVLDGHHPGDTVTLTYLKGGGIAQSVPVTLAEGPPN
jgi:S1-C subfamily serine protease